MVYVTNVTRAGIYQCTTAPALIDKFDDLTQAADGVGVRINQGSASMSADRKQSVVSIVASPNNSAVMLLYNPSPVTPPGGITAVDDVLTPPFYFNVDPPANALTCPTSILANDVPTPNPGDVTINSLDIDAEASIDANGLVTVTTSHSITDPSGPPASFHYTVTDNLTLVESNSAEVTYRVINFGGTTTNFDIIQNVGDFNPVDLGPYFNHLGMLDGDIGGSVDDNGIGSSVTGLFITPNTTVAAQQPYTVTFTYQGYTATVGGILTIAENATATYVDDSLGSIVAGNSSVTSVLTNDTYSPAFDSNWAVRITSSTPVSMVALDPNTGILNVPGNTTPGAYTATYIAAYNSVDVGSGGNITFTVTAPPPIYTAQNDVIAPGYYHNIYDVASNQPSTVSILANDLPTPGPGDVTINTSGLDPAASVDTAGFVSVTLSHPIGFATFDYTLTDVNNQVSNSATVTYVVASLGGTATLNINQMVGENTPIDLSPLFTHLGIFDSDIIGMVNDGGIGSTLNDLVLNVNTTVANSQPYTVTFTLPGSSFGSATISGTMTIVAPQVTFVNDSLGTLNGFSGATSATSVMTNDTYLPSPSDFTVEISVAPAVSATLSPTGFLTIPPSTAAGNYSGEYVARYTPTGQIYTPGSGTFTFSVYNLPTAVDDDLRGTPVNGVTGGTVGMIYANDDSGNSPPVTGSLILNNGLTGLTLHPTTGVLTIPPNSSPGDYTASYSINNNAGLSSSPGNIMIRVFVQRAPGQTFPTNSLDIQSYTSTPAAPPAPVRIADPNTNVDDVINELLAGYTGPDAVQIEARVRQWFPRLKAYGNKILSARVVDNTIYIARFGQVEFELRFRPTV